MLQYLQNVSKIQIFIIIIAIIAGVYYRNQINTSPESIPDPETQGARLFTKDELSTYDKDDRLYLSILGSVYDVTRGVKHYGKDCAYNFFVGRDASASFITGEFEKFVEGEADDVLRLKKDDLVSLRNWKNFYDEEYIYKGKLIGRFYDETGSMTKYHMRFNELVKLAEEERDSKEELLEQYPDCNVEWKKETGTKVWCTDNSGGKHRSWKGYPRKLFEEGSENFRCACIKEDNLDTTAVTIKPYENCDRLAYECFYNVD